MVLKTRRPASIKVRMISTLIAVFALVLQPFASMVFGNTANAAAGITHTVCQAAGSCDYTSIQDAINAPTTHDGDTVTVAPGTYTGDVTINKDITLTTPHNDGIIDGQVTIPATGSGATLYGFTVQTTGKDYSVGISNADNVTISNNKINKTSFTGTAKAIYVGDGDDSGVTITNNYISTVTSATGGAYGILINQKNFSNLKITDNVIKTLTGKWTHAIGLEGNTPGAIVTNNHISGLNQNANATGPDTFAIHFEANPSDNTVNLVGDYNGKPLTNSKSDIYVDQAWSGASANAEVLSSDGTYRYIGQNAFSSIQAAVDAATNGGKVTVAAGTYSENVSINKAVTVSSNSGATLNGQFTVVADGVTINGFTINDSRSAVIVISSDNVTLTNNVVNKANDNYIDGFEFNSGASDNATIAGNTFNNGNSGNAGNADISFVGDPAQVSLGLVISGNTSVNGATFANLGNVSGASVHDNTVTGASGSAIYFAGNDVNTSITHNSITNGIGTAINISNYFYGPSFYITIDHNDLSGNATGVKASNNITDSRSIPAAQGNWWGSVTGPTDKVSKDGSITDTNVLGTGSSAVGAVNYSGWATDSNFTHASSAPTVTILKPTENNNPNTKVYVSNKQAFTISGTAVATDGTGIFYNQLTVALTPAVGGATVYHPSVNTDGTWSVSVPAGTLTDGQKVIISAAARSGSTIAGSDHAYFVVDNTAPTATINSKAPVSLYNTKNGVHVSVKDTNYDKTVFHRTDPAYDFTYTASKGQSFNVAWMGDGDYTMTVYDKAGNSTTYNYTVDGQSPQITITAAEQTGRNTISFNGTVNDQHLNYYYCYLTTNQVVTYNGTTYNPGQEVGVRDANCQTTWAHGQANLSGTLGSFDVTGLPTGSYTVNMVAYDLAGNNNVSTPATFVVQLDHTAPVVTIDQPTAIHSGDSATFTGTTNDASATLSVTFNGKTYQLTSADVTGTNWTLIVPGSDTATLIAGQSYPATVSATDAAGNQSDSTAAASTTTLGVKNADTAGKGSLSVSIGDAPSEANRPNANQVAFVPTTEDQQNDTAVLGTQTSKDPSSTDKAAVITPSSHGWNIFGLAWYWWLLILAVIAAIIWWIAAARRRSADNA